MRRVMQKKRLSGMTDDEDEMRMSEMSDAASDARR